MKIAVIGAGSSGLVTLKYLLDAFPASDIVCFEKGQSVRGCWGNQRPEFVSTSTKYTTQFSCFRKWSSETAPRQDYSEFYRGDEFGQYLEEFAAHFDLHKCIRFGVEVRQLAYAQECWNLILYENGEETRQTFEAVFLCTGLADQKASLDSKGIPIAEDFEGVRNATVVVVGGGESASDVANTLAQPGKDNTVYLSLRSGIRVSPRYHPIRGVPSDFLRNRLLLSFDKGLRNRVGERFVTFRIRSEQLLARWFPHPTSKQHPDERSRALRREWDLKLKARARGELFNVFHNKSDDFLETVAEGRLQIIGPPLDKGWTEYYDFDRSTRLHLTPDLLIWSAGYRSRLADLSAGLLCLPDFYLGCIHIELSNLFLIGFARPIIGNIPSIAEMQARYTVGLLSGKYALRPGWNAKQTEAWEALSAEYPAINTANVYPVEQFPYCDRLAREMGSLPRPRAVGSLRTWARIQLSPASTTHYVDEYFDRSAIDREKVYMPAVIWALLALVRLAGLPLGWIRGIRVSLLKPPRTAA